MYLWVSGAGVLSFHNREKPKSTRKTPTYLATKNNHIEVVRFLLAAGANLGASFGRNAVSFKSGSSKTEFGYKDCAS